MIIYINSYMYYDIDEIKKYYENIQFRVHKWNGLCKDINYEDKQGVCIDDTFWRQLAVFTIIHITATFAIRQHQFGQDFAFLPEFISMKNKMFAI